jgi:COP9 signalosome complex subunit 7
MPEPASAKPLEQYVLLANGAKGAAAVGLVQQVLESPTVYVFGELLDHVNIKDLETNTTVNQANGYFNLLNIFAYGTYSDYLSAEAGLPSMTEAMRKKLRLLTIATVATKEKTIKYEELQTALGIQSIRELEDLIIEGANNSVLKGKLDQKSKHFEVDYAMGRDIRKSDIGQITETLQQWCENCDAMLTCIETQVVRANSMKENHLEHKNDIEKKVNKKFPRIFKFLTVI